MQKLRTVKLLGAAGRKFGRSFRLDVKSPAEAFRALCVLCPGLRAWVLYQHERGVAWRVITDSPNGVKSEELKQETGAESIIFAPLIAGAGGGGGGFFSIILGVVLIVAAIFIPGVGVAVGLAGAGLVFGGVAQLLTPTPVIGKAGTGGQSDEELESNLFSRGSTNGAQGEVVPVIYGTRRVPAPRVISFDLSILPSSRSINTSSTGLLGYVNQQNL
tara:strand:+ start:2463 stop:3113 length:651 start_codon:yes stop_codon:yes gene_type:complete